MSALRAPAAVPSRPAAPSRRARLTALEGGRAEGRRRFAAVRAPLQARSGAPFLTVCGAVLGAALLAVLLLNTTMAHNSYEMARLQNQSARLAQGRAGGLHVLRDAEMTLANRAERLGMVPAGVVPLLDISPAVSPAAAALTPPGGPETSGVSEAGQ